MNVGINSNTKTPFSILLCSTLQPGYATLSVGYFNCTVLCFCNNVHDVKISSVKKNVFLCSVCLVSVFFYLFICVCVLAAVTAKFPIVEQLN